MPRQPLEQDEKITPEAEFISNEADYIKFLDRLYAEEGVDLAQYKQNQLRRRINMTIRLSGQTTYCGFLDFAKKNDEVYRKFIDRITINVSEFLRNADKFEILEHKYIVPMLRVNPSLQLWSAGCSTGEEPYSLALLLRKHSAGPGARVLGWDFDRKALATAAAGIYEAKSLANVPKDLLAKYFTAVDETHYQASDQLKKLVRMEKHNLLEDRFPASMDIILCRNVVIYFNERAKRELFARFAESLSPNGVLMIGASERIPNADEIGLRSIEPFFYARAASNYPGRPR